MLQYKRIVLVGKGGSGKDYMRKIFEKRGFNYEISYTTRPPRDGEKHCVDYFFISKEEFENMIASNEWYEYVEFNGWFYGTTNAQFYKSTTPIFIMTPSGVAFIKPEDRTTTLIIYINPPQGIINNRLQNRNMPGDGAERRILADIEQFKDFKDYDIMIANPDV